MIMKPILEIQNISKKFRIRHQGHSYLSLRDSLASLFKASNDTSEDFFAVNDLSFNVMPGESIGIIGKNGAGKSTLLKILSKITPPTSGKIISRGRIASLLEVGTGFHAELSGRENIFLNGSILGMKKAEIKKNFDAIVDFSGVEKFLDTPLKHYSSGMQLRLAFAVAAFLENEILIIDEVLAVGDSEFQKKCMGKMEDVSRNQGRTVLFVSHNLPSLKAICTKGVLLQNGSLIKEDTIESVIDYYTSYHQENKKITESLRYFQPFVEIHSIKINGSETNTINLEENNLIIDLDLTFTKTLSFELDLHLKKDDVFMASFANFVKQDAQQFEKGNYHFRYEVKIPELRSGLYKIDLYFSEPFATWYAVSESTIGMQVINDKHHIFLNNSSLKWGGVLLEGKTEIKKLSE